MKRFIAVCGGLALIAILEFTSSAQASPHFWNLTSPDHGQTFSYGSEQGRVWAVRGRDRHLALLLNFTNDPYVARQNPREYDHFTFNFPQVTLGSDGRTFFYHSRNRHAVPVAAKHSDFLDVDEITLLPTSLLIVKQPHGYLTLTLVIGDHPSHSDEN